jgi:N-acetylglucosaminyl-diphospho-decaprenol L-rhamnosyltransferase
MLFTLSIVSHGHSENVCRLLKDLNDYKGPAHLKILLTWNAPELETVTEQDFFEIAAWPLTIIKNQRRQGFSQNHNAALINADSGVWCIVNPDITMPKENFHAIHQSLSKLGVGLVYPTQLSPTGKFLDYQRELVTPWALFKRYCFRTTLKTMQVDWVSGCFMAFHSSVYQQLKGFDEKYFLYCEDIDICLRLQLAGYKMAEADFSIIHDTHRGTLKKWDHFKWHVSSLLKLWSSRAFWDYLRKRHKIRQR